MTSDSLDENRKFAPNKVRYEVVPNPGKEHYQRHLIPSLLSADKGQQIDYDNTSTKKRGIFHQIIATCAVLLLSAAFGMPIGYSAVLLPQLTSPNATTEIAIDIEMGSWIASVHSLATPVGSLLSGSLADLIGRRTTLLVSVIPIFIGWSFLALSQSYTMLIAGRMICGFAVGILGGPAQVYIAETAEPNLRSLLIGAPFVSYSLGILIVYALGSTLHWRTVAWCGNILPALAAAAIFCIPESPAWLLRKKKQSQALKALSFLRGNEISAQKEMNEMSERLESEQSTITKEENIFKLLCRREAIKPLATVILLSLLQMCSGTFLVVFYAIDIISEFGANFNTNTAAIWTAVVRMICTLIFCVILLFVRRRRILIISGIGSGLCCLALSVYMYMHVDQPKTGTDVMIAASCLLVYIAFNTPLMVMPGIMIGELFPAKIRGRTAGGVFAAMNIALFCLTKAFPVVQGVLRMRGVFMVFAIASFMVSFSMFLVQPETKGRSLEQIEDYFKGDHWIWFKRDKSYKAVKTHSKNVERV